MHRMENTGQNMTLAEKFLEEHGIPVSKLMSSNFRLYEYNHGSFRNYEVRNTFINKFGFCILTDEIAKTVATYGPLIEIGAGSGYWAHEIRCAGGDIIATDPGTGSYAGNGGWKNPWIEIERIGGVEAVTKYPERNLLTVWPDYSGAWAYETLCAFKGSTVLYAGENRGCTADDDFHDFLEKHFEEIEVINVPQFNGIHDYLGIWRRR